jgi:hypothetical protein
VIISPGQEESWHRPGCRAPLHVPFHIKLAPVAWAFEKSQSRIPPLTAPEMRATVVERHNLLVSRAFDEPATGFGHMHRHIRTKPVENFFGNFPPPVFPYFEKGESPNTPYPQ